MKHEIPTEALEIRQALQVSTEHLRDVHGLGQDGIWKTIDTCLQCQANLRVYGEARERWFARFIQVDIGDDTQPTYEQRRLRMYYVLNEQTVLGRCRLWIRWLLLGEPLKCPRFKDM